MCPEAALIAAATATVVDLAGQELLIGLGLQQRLQLDRILDALLQAGLAVAFGGTEEHQRGIRK